MLDHIPQFPIVFESRDLVVQTNPSGEVFVKNKHTGCELRINEDKVIARHNCQLTPTSVNGLSAFNWSAKRR